MKPSSAFTYLLPLFFLVFIFVSCDTDENPVGTLEEAVERIPDVQLIDGADNATVNVRSDRVRSNYRFSVKNLAPNSNIPGGVFYAWCVEMEKPISTNLDLTGSKLYRTDKDPVFNKLAYIINNRGTLERQNPGLSWKDIQVAFWVILETEDMKLEKIADRTPSFVEGYNATYVNNILEDVQSNGSSFSPGVGHTQLFLMDAGGDEQWLVGESNTAWARMNNNADDFTFPFNPDPDDPTQVGGGNWATYIEFTVPGPGTFPLFAGQTFYVGDLTVEKDNDNLIIKYQLFDEYVLSITHVEVVDDFDDFPTTDNKWDNPKIGNFNYGNSYEDLDFDEWPNNDTVSIPWIWGDADKILIAAHAVVWKIEE